MIAISTRVGSSYASSMTEAFFVGGGGGGGCVGGGVHVLCFRALELRGGGVGGVGEGRRR